MLRLSWSFWFDRSWGGSRELNDSDVSGRRGPGKGAAVGGVRVVEVPGCRGPGENTGGQCFLQAGRSPDLPRMGLCSETGRSPPRRVPLLRFDGLSQK